MIDSNLGEGGATKAVWPDALHDSVATGVSDGIIIAINKFCLVQNHTAKRDTINKFGKELCDEPSIKAAINQRLEQHNPDFLVLHLGGDYDQAVKLAAYIALGVTLTYLEENRIVSLKTLRDIETK